MSYRITEYVDCLIKYLANNDINTILSESSHFDIETDYGMKNGRLIHLRPKDNEHVPVVLSAVNGVITAYFISLNKVVTLCKRGDSGGWCNIITSSTSMRGGLNMSEFVKLVIPRVKGILEDNIARM